MPVYEYYCPLDKSVWSRVLSIREYDLQPWSECPECGEIGKREFSVQIAPVMQEHYNPNFGVVSDPRDYQRILDAKSRHAEDMTGVAHNYQVADLSDTKALGVDESIAATVKNGKRVSGEDLA